MTANATQRRVVVTGLGVVSSLGHDIDTFWSNLIAGQCGIDRISLFDASKFDFQMAAEVREFDATAAHALGEAWRPIKMGDATVMFAGGSEATIVPLGIGGFCAMKALSTRNDEPQRASRPFDAERDGFVMGEGAGVIVMEELEHARARGARVYCEMIGYGNTADANHMTAPAPEGEGAARCMKAALRSASLRPEDISYINAHGTSTPQGDICETQAIKNVFGAHARRIAVSS